MLKLGQMCVDLMPSFRAVTLAVSSMCARQEAKIERLFSSKSFSFSCWNNENTLQQKQHKQEEEHVDCHLNSAAYLAMSEEGLDHSAPLGDPQIDHR